MENLNKLLGFFRFLLFFFTFSILSHFSHSRSIVLDTYGRKGSVDYDIFIGLNLSNLGNQLMPLSAPKQKDFLSYSLDTMLGMGYFLTNELSLGFETGFSLNTIDPFGSKKNPSYSISDLASMNGFWGWLTPGWLSSHSIPSDSLASARLLNMEVPFLLYLKFSFIGKFFQKVELRGVSFSSYFRIMTLQFFTGVNLAFTKITSSFYQGVGNSLMEIYGISHDYFLTEFTAGFRFSLSFLSIQYFYHQGLNSEYLNYDYYRNRAHRISIGLILNGFFL